MDLPAGAGRGEEKGMRSLCVLRASRAFLTASRLLCMSSSGIRMTSTSDEILISLELIHSNRDAVRKAPEAHLIHKGNTLFPLGINRRDEAH